MTGAASATYRFDHVHQPQGWLSPGYVTVVDGAIRDISAQPPTTGAVEAVGGYALPGMHNLHSHAFQRALVGQTEFVSASTASDDLWTWRESMYRLVDAIDPDDYEAIAEFTYVQLLKGGFTTVCEFHYLHHARGGARYGDPAEMSMCLGAAARASGIALTLLPTLYMHGGIGRDVSGPQRRFAHSGPDEYLALIDSLAASWAHLPTLAVGIAFHSLRAVAPAELVQVLAATRIAQPQRRVHIHVSETLREVAEVEAGLGARPVRWLLDEVGLDGHWTLVHATHLDAVEREGLARSGAVAGLCPLTEATLGDGVFPLLEHHASGGRWGIGTDSQYDAAVAAELRMLECGQRLRFGRRNVLAEPGPATTAHSGRRLYDLALAGGASASGREARALAVGERADLIVLNPDVAGLIGHCPATLLDAWLLSGTERAVRDVMVEGRWVIRDGCHPRDAIVAARFSQALARVRADRR